jgi:hypothetical protein
MTRLRWIALAAVVAVSLVAEQFAHHDHEYWFTGIPAFFVISGFIGCVAIIYLSKWYGKYGVQRGEDYYERHGDADGHQASMGAADPRPDAAGTGTMVDETGAEEGS